MVELDAEDSVLLRMGCMLGNGRDSVDVVVVAAERNDSIEAEARDVLVIADAVLAEDSALFRVNTDGGALGNILGEMGSGEATRTSLSIEGFAAESLFIFCGITDGAATDFFKGLDTLRAAGGVAAEAALPRGMRGPVPGPMAGGMGDVAGNETEADRRLVEEYGFRDSNGGTGEVKRLSLSSNIEDGRPPDVTESDRLRSKVVWMRRRVNAEGASSSSLEDSKQLVLFRKR